ncbi:MAG: hypothetical protein ACRBN8_41015 [Nannocystales bacterium]
MPITLLATAVAVAHVGEAGTHLGHYGLLVVFAVPALVGGLLTRRYCRRAVRCPHCDASLWGCGTGSFKARHMRIRANACPCCDAQIR